MNQILNTLLCMSEILNERLPKVGCSETKLRLFDAKDISNESWIGVYVNHSKNYTSYIEGEYHDCYFDSSQLSTQENALRCFLSNHDKFSTMFYDNSDPHFVLYGTCVTQLEGDNQYVVHYIQVTKDGYDIITKD